MECKYLGFNKCSMNLHSWICGCIFWPKFRFRKFWELCRKNPERFRMTCLFLFVLLFILRAKRQGMLGLFSYLGPSPSLLVLPGESLSHEINNAFDPFLRKYSFSIMFVTFSDGKILCTFYFGTFWGSR